ncbi:MULTISPECIES: hypothetical protein [Streptomyces]|jgi:hypothetical protein|uniref:Uncharacterized protein n=1 Tax=Streptomyces spinosisporus TaxID=2927582 RepID=A0ABS9XWY2_9ACTN|nr:MULTISPECIES: hypothetical protein [Streptomyces]MCI3246575.1 hypothetical protein [Streptomyces spinosisporus]WUB37601.1 hypothetical protein OHN38_22865 [Streptomyces sp. NBC_00588]
MQSDASLSDGTGEEDPFAGAAAGDVIAINIQVPSTWYEFDVHPATVNRSIREVVAQRVKERPELGQHQADLIRTLKKVAREARNNRVVYCGSMCEIVDDEPMVASLTVSVTAAVNEATGETAPTGPDTFMDILSPIAPGRRPTDPWRRVSVVDLPETGRAARTEGVEDIEVPDDNRSYRAVMMQTFVPFPGGDPKVAVISASTPQLALAEPMLQLFDLITSTFRFVRRADLDTES